MPLPRPPLHVDVTPSLWDLLANLMGIVAVVGTAAMLIAATMLHLWPISRTRRPTR